MSGWLAIAGLGPGAAQLITPEVTDALAQATDLIGYAPYVARVPAREGLTRHGSDNREELGRAGLPVLLKDNIDVAGMPTTASSIVLEHSVPDKDAFVVQRLKAAGAVILGKVNLTEFAAWVSNNQSSGNGSLHGQVLNPYDRTADPSGSSSGSGSAMAAGLAALTLGSDTEGSIVYPAANQGVIGLRPSTGLISRSGVVPISSSQDTLGPMTMTVTDTAMLLDTLVGVDPEDPHTAETVAVEGTKYTDALKTDALQGARIGVWSDRLSGANYAAMRDALVAQGAVRVD